MLYKWILLIGKLILIPPLIWLGIILNQFAFSTLESIRKLERVPHVPAEYIVPGIVHIYGKAEIAEETIKGPHSEEDTLAYYYRIYELTIKDGEIDDRTLRRNRHGYVPFSLVDESGSVRILPDADALKLPLGYRTREKYEDRERHLLNRADELLNEGLDRLPSRENEDGIYLEHREDRLDAGDDVFVVGMAVADGQDIAVTFQATGDYVPQLMLSWQPEIEERRLNGIGSIILITLGLLSLTLAVYLILNIAGIHRALLYLFTIGLTVFSALAVQSYFMIERDIHGALHLYENQARERTKVVSELMQDWDGNWDLESEGFSSIQDENVLETIQAHKLILARYELRLHKMFNSIGERLVLRSMDIEVPERIPLQPEERARVERIEEEFESTTLSPVWLGLFLLIGGNLTLVLTPKAMRQIYSKRWIENIPQVKTGSVVYGLNKVKGRVSLIEDRHLISPITKDRCCYYHYHIESKRDGASKWEVTHRERKVSRFICEDQEGGVLVDPKGALIYVKNVPGPWSHRTVKTVTRNEKNYQYNYSELHHLRLIKEAADISILGYAVVDPETHDRLILTRQEGLPFIVSEKKDMYVMQDKSRRAFLNLNFGLNGFTLACLGILGYFGGFDALSFQIAGLAPVGYFSLLMVITLYNDMIFLLRRCDAMFANIDVAMKKKIELLEELVEVGRAYMAHENWLQSEMADLRTGSKDSGPVEAKAETKMLLAHAFFQKFTLAAENYPDLNGAEVMVDIKKKISDLDDEIAFMRDGYNNAVEIYNTRVSRIPEILLAKIFRFKKREYFNLDFSQQRQ